MLQKFSEQRAGYRKAQPLIAAKRLGQILPAACGYKASSAGAALHTVKMLRIQLQIRKNCRVKPLCVRVVAPDGVVFRNFKQPNPVHRDRVEASCRFVVRRRIACRGNDPAFGEPMGSKLLALQQLQHRGHQRFRHAVDFIQKQNAGPDALLFHPLIDVCQNLAHGILGGGIRFSAEDFFADQRQPQRALARVVGHGVGHQIDPQLLRQLIEYRRLADARRSHEKKRPLMHERHAERAIRRSFGIGKHRAPDFFLCLFYIHPSSLPGLSASSTSRIAQRGMLISS